MNERSDTERLLRHFLADGPSTMPDRVVDVVADRIGRRRQRRTWRLHWRLQEMNRTLIYAAALAAAVIVAVIGYSLLPRQQGVGTPSAPASPTPSIALATATPGTSPVGFSCADPKFRCDGVIAPGAHTTTAFRPTLTFVAETGWVNTVDRDRSYTMHNLEWPAHFFQIYSQVAIPEQNTDCAAQRKTGVGTSVDDWVAFLTTHPGLATSSPVPFTLGTDQGVEMDLHVVADWTATCPNSVGPAVFLMTNDAAEPDRVKWIDDQYVTMWIVDVSGATVIVYLESGPTPSALAELKGHFEPFVDTFRFTPTS